MKTTTALKSRQSRPALWFAATLMTAATGFAAAAPALAAPAPAQAVGGETFISEDFVESPQQHAHDGDYTLIAQAGTGNEAGSLTLLNKQGKLLSMVDLGYQPTRIVKVRSGSFWVNDNSGQVALVTRSGSKLAVKKTIRLTNGLSGFMTITKAGTVAASFSDDEGSTVFTFDSSTGKVLKSNTFPGIVFSSYAQAIGASVVTSFNDGDSCQLAAINIETLAIDNAEVMRGSAQGMALDDRGRLWVVLSDRATVVAVDPVTLKTRESVEIPGLDDNTFALDVAYDKQDDSLVLSVPSTYVDMSGIVEVSVKTQAVVSDYRIRGDYPSAISVDSDGQVWTSNIRHRDGDNAGGTLSIIDMN